MTFGVQSEVGRLTFSKLSFPHSSAAALAYTGWYWHELLLRPGTRLPAPFTAFRRRRGTEALAGVTLPHWAVAASTALGPGAWVVAAARRYRRRHRVARERLCAHCSYDLTGNVSGVRPECGGAIVTGNTRNDSPAGCSTPQPYCR